MQDRYASFKLDNVAWSEVTDVEAGYDRIAELVSARREAGASLVTVLVPTVEASSVYKEEIAERGRGFGTRVEAFDVWLADMWELHGDGRRFVDAASRGVLCALELQAAPSLRTTPGTIGLMSRMVQESLPLLASKRADEACLSPNERELVECARSYRAQLMERGLVEPCEASCALGETIASQALICSGFDPDQLTPSHRTILSAACADVIVNLRTKAPDGPRPAELEQLLESLFREEKRETMEPTGALRLVLPAGLLAEDRLIVGTLAEIFEEMPGADVLLASANPEKTFYSIAGDLVDRGVSVALKTSKPLSETGVGRALSQAISLIERAGVDGRRAGADFLANDVVKAGYRSTFHADAHIRKDRLISAGDAFETISDYSPSMWAETLEDLSRGNLVSAFGKMSAAVIHTQGLSEGYRREQEEALAAIRKFATAAERESAPLRIMADAMEGQHVEVAVEALAAPGDCRVEIVGMEEASSRRALSCDILLVCQMTSADRPVRDRTTSRHVLMEKLGEPIARDPLGRERRVYYDALATARSLVVLERSRHDADSDPAYPSAMFEETTALYRSAADPSAEAKLLGAPDSLLPFTARLDETRYVYAVTGAERQDMIFSEEMPATGAIESGGDLVLLPKGDRGERCVSASAIEKYLECPYLWFAQSRLGIDELDEAIGPKELGSFVHKVLEVFHEKLSAAGLPRVTADNTGEAVAVMKASFDEVLESQAEMKPKSGRYAVSSHMERERAAAVKRGLVSYVAKQEASLLPGFLPTYHELRFGYEEPVLYAGLPIRGSIDRIDTAPDGRAVVIDYKTGEIRRKWHELIEDPFAALLPKKVQGLIYAQIVRRILGLDVVGLAYVNPLDGSIAPVYDEARLGKKDFPGKPCHAIAVEPVEPEYNAMFHSFGELLDWAETEISERIAPMARGCVEPQPSTPDACKYCPAMLCERRP